MEWDYHLRKLVILNILFSMMEQLILTVTQDTIQMSIMPFFDIN